MRSSKRNHYRHCEKKSNSFKLAKLSSAVIGSVIVVSAIAIPSVTSIQDVEALAFAKNAVISIGNTQTYSEVIVNSCKTKTRKKTVKKKAESEKPKADNKNSTTNKVKKTKKQVSLLETQTVETVSTQPTQAPTEAVKPTLAQVQPVANTNYVPGHVDLPADQREKLERLVMGEGGSMSYQGCLLVAHAIRDAMVLSNTNSVDAIIAEYQYSASLEKKPNAKVKKAVAEIFDNDGYAINHRLLYFYASDMVSNPWHESQNFITSCENVRFFDKW